MKHINLYSLINAYTSLNEEQFKQYLSYFGCNIKQSEVNDLKVLVERLAENGLRNFNDFFIGYRIEQISSDFDLLRFGGNQTINIELKRKSTEDRILKQLIKNKYYLGFLDSDVSSFTYIVEDNILFMLDEDNTLKNVPFTELVQILNSQEPSDIKDINTMFKPSNYLVSPFNSTKKFMDENYFLTEHQSNIKKEILMTFENNTKSFIGITGKPGTGKTLLTYDIAKSSIIVGKKVLIIHCGKLNDGHRLLEREYGWFIRSIRDYDDILNILKNFDLIIMDETQRMYANQFDKLVVDIKDLHLKCIFSYDPQQCFSDVEFNRAIPKKIEQHCESKIFSLTDTIRTNREIAAFINNLFDLSKINNNESYQNINIQYFNDSQSARQYIDNLSQNYWQVINYTTSSYYNVSYDNYQYSHNYNAHEIIGQEFDKVVAVIDSYFYYDSFGLLNAHKVHNAPNYDIDKMLYQITTRARQKLTVVIISNINLLEKCLNILGVHKIPTKESIKG